MKFDTGSEKAKDRIKKKIRVCEMCGIEYIPTGNRQTLCGSYIKKQGCSHIHRLKKRYEYSTNARLKNVQKDRERKRQWRLNNPDKQKLIEKRNYLNKKMKKYESPTS